MNKFHPLKNEKIVISIRIDSNKLDEIDQIAAKIDISRNDLINQCINYSLNNLEFQDNQNLKIQKND